MERSLSRTLAHGATAALLALAMPVAALAQSDEEPTWLVVLQGQVLDATETSLALATGPHGLAFTDRPAREVQVFDLAGFVEAEWAEGAEFHETPPNASLVDGSTDAIAVVEITAATWAEGELDMDVVLLQGEPPAIGDHVALTVDETSVGYNDQLGSDD